METSESTMTVACRTDENATIVNFVERNPAPNGYELVDPYQSGKKTQFDLVELAANIQKADQARLNK